MVVFDYIFFYTFTLLVYCVAMALYRRYRVALLHPIILSAAAIIVVIIGWLEYSVEEFDVAMTPVNFMLGPAVVTLGWSLYKQIDNLRAHMVSILTTIFIGAVVGVVSVVVISRLFGADLVVEASLIPKSVTTPIALEVSHRAGGIRALTAVMVVLTGIYGSVVAPAVLRAARVTDPVAKGLAIGAAAHAVGTARAMEIGAVEGAIGALAIGLMGLMTAVLTPLIQHLVTLF